MRSDCTNLAKCGKESAYYCRQCRSMGHCGSQVLFAANCPYKPKEKTFELTDEIIENTKTRIILDIENCIQLGYFTLDEIVAAIGDDLCHYTP